MSKQQGYGLRLQKPAQQGRLHLNKQPGPPLRLTLPQQPAPRQDLTLASLRPAQQRKSTQLVHPVSHGSCIGYQIDTSQTPWQQTSTPIFLEERARNRGVYLLG